MILARTATLLAAMLFAFVAAAAAPATEAPRAGDGKEKTADQPQKSDREADEMLSAIVRVKMKGIEGARSNDTLGRTREGTGVVIDDKGHIVTIGYIVMEAEAIEVTTQDNRTLPATLAAYDHETGFGLLRASVPLNVKPMALGRSAGLAEREPVMILPAGGREEAGIAYVISKRPFTGSWEYLLDSAIFTAPATMKWAGAALVNRDGELVGIGSLLVRDTRDPGTPLPGNMFVPIDILKPILPDLIGRGRRVQPPRPWLGMATEPLQGRLFVTRVSPDSPAERGGVKVGDIVIGVGAEPVKTHEELYRKLWGLGAAGVEVPLKVLQGADLRDVKLRSIDRFEYFKARPTY